jgi:hypothetical protein
MSNTTKSWSMTIDNPKNGRVVEVQVERILTETDDPTEAWTETTTIYGDLRDFDREEIFDRVARQERCSQYGGQRYVSSPMMICHDETATVITQSGGLDI